MFFLTWSLDAFELTEITITGGLQNSSKKEKRDKKSSGIRGIRGFV